MGVYRFSDGNKGISYLVLVPHGSSAQNRNLCPSVLLKAFNCVPLRSQDLSDKVELEGGIEMVIKKQI